MRKILKESVDFGKIAEKAVAIIKGKGYTVVMFTLDGMETSNPEDARRLYIKKPNFMVTVDEDNAQIRINKNSNVELEEIESTFRQLRNLARQYMLKTELKVFGKEIAPKDFAFQAKKLRDQKMNGISEASKKTEYKDSLKKDIAYYKKMLSRAKKDKDSQAVKIYKKHLKKSEERLENVTEASLSRMHGSKKTSYQTLESTKIVVRHRKPVDDERRGSRSRQIKEIFIERAGERFRFPHNHLAGARAMARHIDEGGDMRDSIGTYIIESVANLKKLAEFVNYSRRNKLINEESEDIIKIVRENISAYKRELGRFQGASSYHKMCEKLANREGSNVEVDETDELKDMFTVRKFDEKIGETLPLIKKLVMEKNAWRSMIEEASEEQFIVTSTEDLIEGDAFEFDSPVQKLGYKLRTLSERVVEESELSKFVRGVSNKLIEGNELSKFEKSVMKNVLENIVVSEKDEEDESGLVDKLEEASIDFERKIKLLEYGLDWDNSSDNQKVRRAEITDIQSDITKKDEWGHPRKYAGYVTVEDETGQTHQFNNYSLNQIRNAKVGNIGTIEWRKGPGYSVWFWNDSVDEDHNAGEKESGATGMGYPIPYCPDCDGEGEFVDGTECLGCGGSGRLDRDGAVREDFDGLTGGPKNNPFVPKDKLTIKVNSEGEYYVPLSDDGYWYVGHNGEVNWGTEHFNSKKEALTALRQYLAIQEDEDDWDSVYNYDEDEEECRSCEGHGTRDRTAVNMHGEYESCPDCQGTGLAEPWQPVGEDDNDELGKAFIDDYESKVADNNPCMYCDGEGCEVCGGQEEMFEKDPDPEDFMDKCPNCKGSGKEPNPLADYDEDDSCIMCHGEGYV